MKRLLALLMLSTLAHAEPPPPGCDATQPEWKLVYTQQPRHSTPIKADGPGQFDIDDASNFQHVNDIARVWQQSEADLVLDDLLGHTKVIHACTMVDRICTAQEGKVSPDGKRIIYSVSVAPPNATKWPVRAANGPMTPLWDFETVEAELWLYDIPTGTKTQLTTGHIDRMPNWASNDLIVFASNRSGTYARRSTLGRNFYPKPAFHIYRAKLVKE